MGCGWVVSVCPGAGVAGAGVAGYGAAGSGGAGAGGAGAGVGAAGACVARLNTYSYAPIEKGQRPKWWERVSSLRAKSPYYHQCASP